MVLVEVEKKVAAHARRLLDEEHAALARLQWEGRPLARVSGGQNMKARKNQGPSKLIGQVRVDSAIEKQSAEEK
ncbi:uncharacterized protein A4U43_C03F25400 [Asparagus officinalis]|uniref:Uncharacterized protein n=1 Tax=Asparagus officinalis TaxID=4686 RepID=A0A5P1FES1_ASPOF|nr:uncharacterized protein A4U43_C03F25400 [Asparagus officinalis]